MQKFEDQYSPLSYYLSRSRKCTDTPRTARSHHPQRSTALLAHTPRSNILPLSQRVRIPRFSLRSSHILSSHEASSLRGRHHDALVLSRGDVFQSALEVPPRALNRSCVLVRLEIGVDELDEAVDVLDSHLASVNNADRARGKNEGGLTASFCWSK